MFSLNLSAAHLIIWNQKFLTLIQLKYKWKTSCEYKWQKLHLRLSLAFILNNNLFVDWSSNNHHLLLWSNEILLLTKCVAGYHNSLSWFDKICSRCDFISRNRHCLLWSRNIICVQRMCHMKTMNLMPISYLYEVRKCFDDNSPKE